ncbi:hypothetical protein GCM10007094_15650 [Pseudovibrio japonicus]|uniref:Uncharacterized protein n=1 Tax=Pseudovibrio japonicus TaxID=366534 RepID=A0ABQ3E859_9HYPH|nr:hypothetical protein [Pseudovibrio japonicus]GHB28062.1 hypothetical protein GCM10007094_15650 [Pseudovibrio japonicus]
MTFKPFRSLITAASISLILGNEAMSKPLPSETEVRQSYQAHAAATQLLRWYQFYENTEASFENQLDILQDDVTITSTTGTANGHDEYKDRVAQIPSSWKNSHNLTDFNPTIDEDGNIQINASIIYQNIGMAEDGATVAYNIAYTTKLTPSDELLPKFSEITLTLGDPADAGTFTNLYPKNRLLSLAHYWMTLVEDPQRNAEPFREILAADFNIDFGRGAITTFDGFAEWIAGPASSVSASRHELQNFSYKELGDNRYELTVDLDWTGILPNDAWMTAKTRHTWTVSDNPQERFARIEKINVEVLEPFSPVEN